MHAAQAQKEITHNEALVLLDSLLPGCVVARANDPAGISPLPGQAWVVGRDALATWADHADEIAVYSEGGWRFAPAVLGMRVFDLTAGVVLRYDGSGWVIPPAIAAPSGGGTIDAEARTTLTAVLTALRQAGLVAVT